MRDQSQIDDMRAAVRGDIERSRARRAAGPVAAVEPEPRPEAEPLPAPVPAPVLVGVGEPEGEPGRAEASASAEDRSHAGFLASLFRRRL